MLRHLLSAVLFAGFLATSPALAKTACHGRNLFEELAPSEQAGLLAEVARYPYPEGNLWLAQKGASRLHVVGSIHLEDPRTAPLVSAVTPLVQQADGLFLEVLSEDNKRLEKMLLGDLEIAFIDEGPTIPEMLSKADWAALRAQMNARKMPSFLVAKMQPWYVGLMLSVPACAIPPSQDGVDMQLDTVARKAGVPRHALDDLNGVLETLRGGDPDLQLKELQVMIGEAGLAEDMMETMLALFTSQQHRLAMELSRIADVRFGGVDEEMAKQVFDDMEKRLLDARNKAWIGKLLPQVEEGEFVVVFGAAHLSGENGMLKLLENAGYTLERVNY